MQVPDFGADGQAVVAGALVEVGVLDGDGEEVAFQGDGGAVVGAGVEDYWLVGVAFLFQLVLVDEEEVTGAVVVDGGPIAARRTCGRGGRP